MTRTRPLRNRIPRRRSARALALPLLAAFAAAQDAALEGITAAELERHVRFLAADELRGRETGTPEQVVAARYLATALAGAGLEPAGDEAGFLQAVPLVRVEPEGDPALTLETADGARLEARYGVDFALLAGEDSVGPLKVLRVGSAEEVPSAPSAELALFLDGGRRETSAWLEHQGGGRDYGALVYRGSETEGRERSRRSGSQLMLDEGPAPRVAPRLRVNGELLARFQAGEVATLALEQSLRREPVRAYNVVGRVAGVGTPARPELAGEVVVFTAHYDHIGAREAPEGASAEELAALDLVYNGADDDASGTACVLELAEAFAEGPPPARTLLFLLVTGEERGLLGTRYYIEHPIAPLEATVANLNFEMIGRPDALAGGPGRLWLTGHERSNLFAAIQEHGIDISPDLRPDQNFFMRSDNIAFAMRGIVAQTISSYDMHGDYHQVSDEADLLDYQHMQAGARASYRISRLVADGAITPEWLPGGSPAR